MSRNRAAAREGLPDTLFDVLERLSVPELRAVRAVVDRRIEQQRPPIEDLIRAEAAGEVVDIEDRGLYAIVRMIRPRSENADAESRPESVYRVRRERRPTGDETLRWSFMDDVGESRRGEDPASESPRERSTDH